jgi:hypothetical protein
MNSKLKVLSVLMLMSMFLAACDNEKTVSYQKQPPEHPRAVYLRSDIDDETWAELKAADERGDARYVAAVESREQGTAGQAPVPDEMR